MLGYSVNVPHAYEIPKVAKFNYEHHARPTSGGEFLHSRHFPDEVQGDYLYTNSIGFLGIKISIAPIEHFPEIIEVFLVMILGVWLIVELQLLMRSQV